MRLKSLLKEPLLHFIALGAALFLYFHWSGGGAGEAPRRIVVSAGQVDSLAASFTTTWHRAPSASELKELVDEWLREEIAVREALAAGLDEGDTIIRRRLRQKLEFLVEDLGESTPPTDVDLSSYLAENPESFRVEPRVALRLVHVSRERRGSAAPDDARSLLDQLVAAGPDAMIDEFGDPTMLPQEIELSALSDVARMLGPHFVDQLASLPTRRWSGPLESTYGLHLALVRERVEGSLPELAEIRPSVEREFLAQRRAQQLSAMYEGLLAKYDVVIEAPRAATSPP